MTITETEQESAVKRLLLRVSEGDSFQRIRTLIPESMTYEDIGALLHHYPFFVPGMTHIQAEWFFQTGAEQKGNFGINH
ncbi:MAG: hypothetical protein K6G61_04785 [Solobacterium sp.]|nr:hypothetical protein [Solobacterium sp.]